MKNLMKKRKLGKAGRRVLRVDRISLGATSSKPRISLAASLGVRGGLIEFYVRRDRLTNL